MSIVINGIEFQDVDFTDVETLEAYQRGLEEFQGVGDRFKGGMQLPEMISAIRELSDVVADWVDDLFGTGAGDRVFGGKASLNLATSIAGDIVEAYKTDFDKCKAEISNRMDKFAQQSSAGSRQERRAAERNRRNQDRRNQNKPKRPAASSEPISMGRYDRSRVDR